MGTGAWSWVDGSTCRYGKGVVANSVANNEVCTRSSGERKGNGKGSGAWRIAWLVNDEIDHGKSWPERIK